jgi:hypothetical protein
LLGILETLKMRWKLLLLKCMTVCKQPYESHTYPCTGMVH